MEPGSRTTREQRGGMRDDNTGTGGQWDDPGSQGQRGGELFLRYLFLAFHPCVVAIIPAPYSAPTGALTDHSFSQ